jgi:argonaute-like protein implicated in RNA metabolism and viral defense
MMISVEDYLNGGRLPEIMLSFRPTLYGDEQSHYDPYVGLKMYGPYKPVEMTILHLIPQEWIDEKLLTRTKVEYLEQILKNHMNHLFEKGMKKIIWENLEIDEITSLTNTESKRVFEKEKDIASKVKYKENCVILTFIPAKLTRTTQRNALYSKMKILGLKNEKNPFAVQCYSRRVLNALEQDDKFTLNNLALNIFAKGGGIPWVLSSSYKINYNIVIGVAWSIKRVAEESTGPVIKYYGVSHIFDEKGAWKQFITFACRAKSSDLLNAITGSLKEIIEDYELPEKSKMLLMFRERPGIQSIKEFSRNVKTEVENVKIDIIRISEGTPLRIYNPFIADWTPPRGLFFRISDECAYVTTTGVYKGKYAGIGTPKPIKIELMYTEEEKRKALKESIMACYALTAMNWRNLFGTLRLPTPIHYAKLMANLLEILPEDDINHTFAISKYKKAETEWELLKPKIFRDRPWFI